MPKVHSAEDTEANAPKKAGASSAFGTWLWCTPLSLSEITQLRTIASSIGASWPNESNNRSDYLNAVRNAQGIDQAQALQALNSLWSVYELARPQQHDDRHISQLQRILTVVIPSLPVLAICALGVGLIWMFYHAFNGAGDGDSLLTKLGSHDTARGLLTFLFGLTTVGIAIIIVIANYLSSGDKDELAARFQQGKDVLTVLIGVFGAILGYYFGADKGTPQTVGANTEMSSTATPGGQKPVSPSPSDKATTKPTPPQTAPAPAVSPSPAP
jgi:hypothetical protein